MTTSQDQTETIQKPCFAQATKVWGKIGCLSFGGPAGQIALMHRLLVDELGWLSEKQFLNALSFCMLLPGPEAMQVATYAGWKLHGIRGGLVAGLLFVLPGALVVLCLTLLYAFFGELHLIDALFIGVKAAVLVIVLEALIRVAKRSLKGGLYWLVTGLSFVGIFFFAIPYPLIILVAAVVGFVHGSRNDPQMESGYGETFNRSRPDIKSTLLTTLFWLTVWFMPLTLIAVFFDQTLLVEIGLFFSRMAVVTFGGAYAVLAYMGQEAVNEFGWLTATQMMDGLGLAETTPGPLILVTQFVGFLAGFKEGGLSLGLAGAVVTVWVTFVPCFLWIFLGAPHIDWICAQPALRSALSGISAAVVGVIANLSAWFALHVLFDTVNLVEHGPLSLWTPQLESFNLDVIVLALLCGLSVFRFGWPVPLALVLSAALSMGMAL